MTTRSFILTRDADPARRISGIRWGNTLTWILQVLLALLFLFAGVAKLEMPTQLLVAQSGLPAEFLQFIAVSEIIGALGLVLPGHFGIRRELTPLAAIGLVMIMIGAVITTVANQGSAPAVFPLVVGILLSLVVRARMRPRAA